ncbi:MAG: hypothetical protein WBX49_00525 [Candidatus Deferrimicrobiaceae bacterium]
MRRKLITMVFVFLLAIGVTAVVAQAETLSWNAVTTYTDGTSIGSTAVTYQAFWSTSSGTSGLNSFGAANSSTSRTFNVDTESMPRGQTIYFRSRATVAGINSAYSSAMSWAVPAATPKTPAAPSNLQMN